MLIRHSGLWLGVALGLFLTSAAAVADDRPAANGALHLTRSQKEFLSLEPILVSLRVEGSQTMALPATPGQGKTGTLRFEIEPKVQPRKGARPLPLEGQAADAKVSVRRF